MIKQSFANNIFGHYSIGLILIITVFIGWFFLKGNNVETYIYVSGISLLIMSTNFFPWEWFKESFLGNIQFPYRLLSYASLCLSVSASLILKKVLDKGQEGKAVFLFSCLMILFIVSYSNVVQSVTSKQREQTSIYLSPNKIHAGKPLNGNYRVNNYNYRNIFDYSVTFGETDYYPKKAMNKKIPAYSGKTASIWKHQAFVNGEKKVLKPIGTPNNISYEIKSGRKGQADLPIVAYSHTYVFVNHRRVHYHISERGTVNVSLKRGKNFVTVGYRPVKMYYLAGVLSMLTWVGLFIKYILSYIEQKNSASENN